MSKFLVSFVVVLGVWAMQAHEGKQGLFAQTSFPWVTGKYVHPTNLVLEYIEPANDCGYEFSTNTVNPASVINSIMPAGNLNESVDAIYREPCVQHGPLQTTAWFESTAEAIKFLESDPAYEFVSLHQVGQEIKLSVKKYTVEEPQPPKEHEAKKYEAVK